MSQDNYRIVAYSKARRADRMFTPKEWELIENTGNARNFTNVRREAIAPTPKKEEKMPAPKPPAE